MISKSYLVTLALLLAAACGDDSGTTGTVGADMDTGDGSTVESIVMDIEPIVDSWTVPQDNPAFDGSQSSLFCRFATNPLALLYTVQYVNAESPPLEFTISWDPGNFGGEREPVPDRGRFPGGENYIPGYDAGLVGPDYFVRVSGSGTQCGLDPGCGADSAVAMEAEARLREVGGICRITIDVAPDVQPTP